MPTTILTRQRLYDRAPHTLSWTRWAHATAREGWR